MALASMVWTDLSLTAVDSRASRFALDLALLSANTEKAIWAIQR